MNLLNKATSEEARLLTFSPLHSVVHPAAQVAFSEKSMGRMYIIRVNSFLYDGTPRTFPLLLSVVNLRERPDSWFPKLTWLWALYPYFEMHSSIFPLKPGYLGSQLGYWYSSLVTQEASLTPSPCLPFLPFFLLPTLMAHTPLTHWHPLHFADFAWAWPPWRHYLLFSLSPSALCIHCHKTQVTLYCQFNCQCSLLEFNKSCTFKGTYYVTGTVPSFLCIFF